MPNQSARRLVTGRTDRVAIVLPFPPDDADAPDVNGPFISDFLRYVAHGLKHLPYLDLIVGYAHEDRGELGVYERFVNGRRVDGFSFSTPRRYGRSKKRRRCVTKS